MSKIHFCVSVYYSPLKSDNRNKIFQRSIVYNADDYVPFDQIYRALRFLFGEGCVIAFDMCDSDSS